MNNEVEISNKPFGNLTGADMFRNRHSVKFSVLAAILLGVLIAKSIYFGVAVLAFFIVSYLFFKLYQKPKIGLDFLFVFSFFAVGLTRLLPLPFGLVVDFITVGIWCVVFFKGGGQINWKPLSNILTYGLLIWALYCVLEIFNPESSSFLAWFYAVRGLALNGILLVPLIFLFYKSYNDFKKIIHIWFVLSILLGLYGAKQYWFGLFSFEQKWLDEGGHVTHVLWGVFSRMFSFSSDANQFGCSQAHAGIVALIFSFQAQKIKQKLYYWVTSAVCFYGMFISGTRGAIVIPIVSFLIYLALSKNFKAIIFGSILGGICIYVLVFTYMFHSVEPIRRMRTAFNATQDQSFIVRIENRRMLAAYLVDKPFGGGGRLSGSMGAKIFSEYIFSQF